MRERRGEGTEIGVYKSSLHFHIHIIMFVCAYACNEVEYTCIHICMYTTFGH